MVAAGSGPTGRWQEIAAGLSDELPGEWSVRGTGAGTILVQEPVDWRLCYVGRETLAHSEADRLYAAVQPLFAPHERLSMQFSTESYGELDGSEYVDMRQSDANERVRAFVTGPAAAMFDEFPVDLLGRGAERNLERTEGRREANGYWLLAPGARVLSGAESPVGPAKEAAEFFAAREDGGFAARYYTGLAEAYERGGREAATGYLERRRDEMLDRFGVSEPVGANSGRNSADPSKDRGRRERDERVRQGQSRDEGGRS